MKTPNYIKALADSGIAKPGRVTGIIILHDQVCGHWRGEACDCHPTIKQCEPAQALRLNQQTGKKN